MWNWQLTWMRPRLLRPSNRPLRPLNRLRYTVQAHPIPSNRLTGNVLALECQMKAEERQYHQAFMETLGVAHMSLRLPENWGDTSVPPTVPDWQCAFSHPSRDVGYCPAAGSSRQRTGTESGRHRVSTDTGRQRVSTVLCKAVLARVQFVLYFFKCLWVYVLYFFIWCNKLTQPCSSSGSLFFAHLGRIRGV